jgi:hypothetical protein
MDHDDKSTPSPSPSPSPSFPTSTTKLPRSVCLIYYVQLYELIIVTILALILFPHSYSRKQTYSPIIGKPAHAYALISFWLSPVTAIPALRYAMIGFVLLTPSASYRASRPFFFEIISNANRWTPRTCQFLTIFFSVHQRLMRLVEHLWRRGKRFIYPSERLAYYHSAYDMNIIERKRDLFRLSLTSVGYTNLSVITFYALPSSLCGIAFALLHTIKCFVYCKLLRSEGVL